MLFAAVPPPFPQKAERLGCSARLSRSVFNLARAMKVHCVKLVQSGERTFFVTDEDGVLLAESHLPLNAATAVLLERDWAKPSEAVIAYLGDEIIMVANVGWIADNERWTDSGGAL
jgi:hypothetical protein